MLYLTSRYNIILSIYADLVNVKITLPRLKMFCKYRNVLAPRSHITQASKQRFPNYLFRTRLGVGIVVVVLGFTVLTIKKDMAHSQIKFEAIRQPPGGIPDKLTLAKYDTFKPGDMIRRSFKATGWGRRHHYGIYIGKNPINGEHIMIDVTIDKNDPDGKMVHIQKTNLVADSGPGATEYEIVPITEMYQLPGTRKISRQEIVQRAKKMLGQTFTYTGAESNCEAFVRAIAEGKAYSTQGLELNTFTKLAIGFLQNSYSKIQMTQGESTNEGVNIFNFKIRLSSYGRNQHRMTAEEITKFLELQ